MKNYLISLLIITITMCKSYEKLTLKKEDYNGLNIKTNGYYYTIYEKDKKYNAFFIYKNGVYYGGNWQNKITFDQLNLKELDNDLRNTGLFVKQENPVQINWGIFNVTNNEIKIERWLSGSGGKYPTQMKWGRIINDSTIHFYEEEIGYPSQYGKGKKREVIDEIYHFRQFSSKPDSTNNFIK